jgi:hypothetical protein
MQCTPRQVTATSEVITIDIHLINCNVKFRVLTAVRVKTQVFWDIISVHSVDY